MDVAQPVPARVMKRFADDHERIEHDFANHAPDDDQVARFVALRPFAMLLGHQIVDLCPSSRERSLALTKLEEALSHAIAAIARSVPA